MEITGLEAKRIHNCESVEVFTSKPNAGTTEVYYICKKQENKKIETKDCDACKAFKGRAK